MLTVASRASFAAVMALTAPLVLRSMQGTCTRPPNGIASQPEVVLHSNFGGVFNLFVTASEDCSKCAGGH